MKKFLLILLCIAMCSCGPLLSISPAEYGLKHTEINPVVLPKDKKYLLLINNDPTTTSEFSQYIENGFLKIFGNHLSRKFRNDYFDNFHFLNIVDKQLLQHISADTGNDYLILVRFLTTTKSIGKEKFIRTESAKSAFLPREYHAVIDVFDLRTGENIYDNEAFSFLQPAENSGWTPTKASQLKQTYDKVFKNFNKSLSN